MLLNKLPLLALMLPRKKPIKRHWDEIDHVEEYRPEDPSLGFYDNNNNSNGNKRIRIDGEAGDMVCSEIDPKITEMLPQIDLVRAKERPLKDRETLLECPNKNFQSVLSIVNKRDDDRRRSEDLQRKEHDRSNLHTPSKNHYGNTDEKRFWKNNLGAETADLGIGPTQSYIGQKDVMKTKPAFGSQRPQVLGTPRASFGSKVKPECVPIILVPSASQTLLNIYNAKDFLEDGVYVAPDVKAKQMPKKPECVTIQRKIGREKASAAYEIRDKPFAFAPSDWERVVAVFVLGKEWQFKDWPFKDHVEIFYKSKFILDELLFL